VRWAIALLLLLGSAWPSRSAQAGDAAIDPEVTQATKAALAAEPMFARAPLRELWRLWESRDPAQIEAALDAIADDERVAGQTRAYAGVLGAYARRRRGDLAGATRQLDALGYVRDWLIVGPFDNDNRSGLAIQLLVEKELDQPVVLDRSYIGKERPVRWRKAPDVHRYGVLDLGAMVRPEQDVCVIATSYVRSADAKPRDLTLWAGATGAYRIYFDGELVLEDTTYRQLDTDRSAARVAVGRGYHRITAKVCGDEGSPALALRIGDARGGVATGIEFATTTEATTDAAARMRAGDGVRNASGRRPVRGPVQALAAALEAGGNDASASLLEGYARYLLVTGGDDPATHLARDLAGRAAEREPTVSRLLLASKLVGDRNARRTLVERAAKLVKTPEERIELALARAHLLRTGPSPRDAFPLYDEVLRLEPGHAGAVLGKVDIYVEAGLSRTSLRMLTEASEAHPHSVALLRALAGQLRALGRDTAASEVESRYAALRFDDASFLQEQMRIAVARRDRAATDRWSSRLLAIEPASQWAHGAIAQSRLSLGDREGAIAAFRAGLAIAPEDTGTLRALSNLYGVMGDRDQQLSLLQQVLRIAPQSKAVRAYVEHIAPRGERLDEKYAWPPEKFLERRAITDDRHPVRTLRKLDVTTVYDNGLAGHFTQVVYQPLTREAAEDGRLYAFVYNADRQVVQLRAAKVYRKDGRVDEAIQSGEAPLNDPSINMYTLQRRFAVQFPRLEPGDVVELRYRIEDVAARNEMSDYFGEVTYLQSTQPVANAEYVLIAPKDKALHVATGPPTSTMLGKVKKTVTTEGDKRIHRFEVDGAPPLETEPRMPRLGELLAHVHVSTFASWSDVGAWYWGLSKDKLAADDDVRKLARELTKGLTDPREQVAAIYRQVSSETRYVALEFGIEGIRPRQAALTLARGWGDCKDKATLFVAMLDELGIAAELVLVRTGLRGGFDPSVASLAPFDHAIAYVPSLDLYLDGTAEDTGTSELPAMDRSSMALRIVGSGSGGKGQLVKLPEPPSSQSREAQRMTLSLDGKGVLRFDGTSEARGADAPSWRKRYQAASTRRERLTQDLAGALGPVELVDGKRGLDVSDLAAVEKPVVLTFRGTAKARKEGGAFAIPSGPPWALVRRLAARPNRTHALLVGPRRQSQAEWTIEVPAGMKVESTPQPTNLQTPFGTYKLEVERSGRKIVVRTRLELDVARIDVATYPAFRAFCQAVDASAGAPVLVAP
jgi:tetratricopeptide (TPR) repeat protein